MVYSIYLASNYAHHISHENLVEFGGAISSVTSVEKSLNFISMKYTQGLVHRFKYFVVGSKGQLKKYIYFVQGASVDVIDMMCILLFA